MRLGGGSLARAAATAVAGLFAVAGALAGSIETRDPEGNGWAVIENPSENADNYLLRHTDRNRQPIAAYGRNGAAEFTLGPDNDTPTSLRVEPTGRAWMVGTGTSGGRPQPVVMRITPDGQADTRWGVQGRVQVNPNGVPVRANDLLPLSDGSVLVAGEAPGTPAPKAVVFHLKADGTIDPAFGNGGLWTRPGAEGAVAVSLGVQADGGIAVGVAVRGEKETSEIWSLYDVPPQLQARDELDEGIDEDELHIEWIGQHWQWLTTAGIRGFVPSVSLVRPAPAASAANDPGQGAFNPFVEHAVTAASAPVAAPVEDGGVPWGWIAAIVALALALLAFVLTRGGHGAAAANGTRR
jgi:uncharacterized delta-60 repeat protein